MRTTIDLKGIPEIERVVNRFHDLLFESDMPMHVPTPAHMILSRPIHTYPPECKFEDIVSELVGVVCDVKYDPESQSMILDWTPAGSEEFAIRFKVEHDMIQPAVSLECRGDEYFITGIFLKDKVTYH